MIHKNSFLSLIVVVLTIGTCSTPLSALEKPTYFSFDTAQEATQTPYAKWGLGAGGAALLATAGLAFAKSKKAKYEAELKALQESSEDTHTTTSNSPSAATIPVLSSSSRTEAHVEEETEKDEDDERPLTRDEKIENLEKLIKRYSRMARICKYIALASATGAVALGGTAMYSAKKSAEVDHELVNRSLDAFIGDLNRWNPMGKDENPEPDKAASSLENIALSIPTKTSGNVIREMESQASGVRLRILMQDPANLAPHATTLTELPQYTALKAARSKLMTLKNATPEEKREVAREALRKVALEHLKQIPGVADTSLDKLSEKEQTILANLLVHQYMVAQEIPKVVALSRTRTEGDSSEFANFMTLLREEQKTRHSVDKAQLTSTAQKLFGVSATEAEKILRTIKENSLTESQLENALEAALKEHGYGEKDVRRMAMVFRKKDAPQMAENARGLATEAELSQLQKEFGFARAALEKLTKNKKVKPLPTPDTSGLSQEERNAKVTALESEASDAEEKIKKFAKTMRLLDDISKASVTQGLRGGNVSAAKAILAHQAQKDIRLTPEQIKLTADKETTKPQSERMTLEKLITAPRKERADFLFRHYGLEPLFEASTTPAA